jgi:succinate dehydrogenase flavin-adding protein (antitoxin of CptAB toxin-antitoxin module)
MPIITPDLLATLGINLSEQEQTLLNEHASDTLNERVMDEIVQELTPEQAEQLAEMADNTPEEIYQWLMKNVPELGQIVSDEVDILLGEIAENSENIAGNNN